MLKACKVLHFSNKQSRQQPKVFFPSQSDKVANSPCSVIRAVGFPTRHCLTYSVTLTGNKLTCDILFFAQHVRTHAIFCFSNFGTARPKSCDILFFAARPKSCDILFFELALRSHAISALKTYDILL